MESKHPFMYFTETIEENCDCSQALLPVCFGSDLRFNIESYADLFPLISFVGFTTISGDFIAKSVRLTTYQMDLSQVDLANRLAENECFRIAIHDNSGNIFIYSNPLVYIGCDDHKTVLFEYWIDGNESTRTRLRAILKKPNPVNELENYENALGDVFTLAKQRRKQFELETDFYPECIHDSIQEMLLHPNILVDEDLMFESGEYTVDWENKISDDRAKGATQLSEQKIMRFANC